MVMYSRTTFQLFPGKMLRYDPSATSLLITDSTSSLHTLALSSDDPRLSCESDLFTKCYIHLRFVLRNFDILLPVNKGAISNYFFRTENVLNHNFNIELQTLRNRCTLSANAKQCERIARSLLLI